MIWHYRLHWWFFCADIGFLLDMHSSGNAFAMNSGWIWHTLKLLLNSKPWIVSEFKALNCFWLASRPVTCFFGPGASLNASWKCFPNCVMVHSLGNTDMIHLETHQGQRSGSWASAPPGSGFWESLILPHSAAAGLVSGALCRLWPRKETLFLWDLTTHRFWPLQRAPEPNPADDGGALRVQVSRAALSKENRSYLALALEVLTVGGSREQMEPAPDWWRPCSKALQCPPSTRSSHRQWAVAEGRGSSHFPQMCSNELVMD